VELICHLQEPTSSKGLSKAKSQHKEMAETVVWCNVSGIKSTSQGHGRNSTVRLGV
jgi:hypothetical protein